MGDTKKIALIVTDRKHEAIRMSVGLTLADDEVNVFVMDNVLGSDEALDLNVETLQDMDGAFFTNHPDNPFEQKSTEEIAKKLTEYDIVLSY
jgi:hypothetical protein